MSFTVIKLTSSDGSITLTPAGGVGVVDIGASILADTPFKPIAKAAAYVAVSRDFVICDATAGSFVVTLPAVVAGAIVTVKKKDNSANTVTMTPASGTIDGAATMVLSAQWESVTAVSDGVNWFII